MKRFLIVLLVVLIAIAILAACAPVSHAPADDADAQPTGIVEYTKSISEELLPGNAIPTWVIITVSHHCFPDRFRPHLEADPRLYQSHRDHRAGRRYCGRGIRPLENSGRR